MAELPNLGQVCKLTVSTELQAISKQDLPGPKTGGVPK